MAKHICDSSGFPWCCHRTLREVGHTDALRAMRGRRPLAEEDQRYLTELEAKERAHNPPRLPPQGEPA